MPTTWCQATENRHISAPYHVAEEKLLTIFRHLWEVAQARRWPLRPQSLDYYKDRLIVQEVKMLKPKAKPDAFDATITELIYIGFGWLPL